MDQNDGVNQGVKSETDNSQTGGEVGTKSVSSTPQPQVVGQGITKQVNAPAADVSESPVGGENVGQPKPPEGRNDQAFQAELIEKENKGQKVVLYIAIFLFSMSIVGLIIYFLLAK